MDEPKGLKIEMSPDKAAGQYANLAVITHGPNDFFIDMICVCPGPGQSKGIVQNRTVMTPENAKQLLVALEENIRKYEEVFGRISAKQPQITITPKGQA